MEFGVGGGRGGLKAKVNYCKILILYVFGSKEWTVSVDNLVDEPYRLLVSVTHVAAAALLSL